MPFLLAEDINLLVLQFLRDSGYLHSAYTFSYEAGIESMRNIKEEQSVKLVELIQKGIYFKELESTVDRICHDEKFSSTVDQFWRKVREAVKSSYTTSHFDFYLNGQRKPDYSDLKPGDVYQVPCTFGRINDMCWGSDNDLVTAHESGTCGCWVVEKSELGVISLKLVHFIEPIRNSERRETLRVAHIPQTVNYCCTTTAGKIRIFSYFEIYCEFEISQAPLCIIRTWFDSKISQEPFAACCSVDGTCVLRSGLHLESVHCIQNFNDCISDCCWSRTGILAVASLDGSLSLLNPNEKLPPVAFNVLKGPILSVLWSREAEYLAIVTFDHISIIKKTFIDKKYEINCHQCEITSIKWIIRDHEDILFSVDVNSFLYYHSYDSLKNAWISKCVKLFSIPIKCIDVVQRDRIYILAGGKEGSLILLDFTNKSIHKSYKLPYEIVDINTHLDGYTGLRFCNGEMIIVPFKVLI